MIPDLTDTELDAKFQRFMAAGHEPTPRRGGAHARRPSITVRRRWSPAWEPEPWMVAYVLAVLLPTQLLTVVLAHG